jgi:uncharacterized protein
MAFAFAALLLLIQRVELAPGPAGPLLIVTGSGLVAATPDQATVRLGILRQANVAQTAQEQANALANEILSAILKIGIPAPQIKTSRLTLSPVYAPRTSESRDAPRIVAYNAVNSISIRLDNLSLIGPVIDAGLKAGANQLEGVQFALRDDLPQREEALKKAVNEARRKASAMAEAMNVELHEVLEISEGTSSNGEIVGYAKVATTPPSPAGVSTPVPVAVGEIEVTADVTIRYRIAPKPQ